MRLAILILSVLMLLQFVVGVAVAGMTAPQNLASIGAAIDARLVQLTVGLIGIYVVRRK